MKTFTLLFIVSACAVAIVSSRNTGELLNGGVGGSSDGQIQRMRRDTSDFQKELEERMDKLKENVQSVKERMMEEYENLKKMVTHGIESMQEKAKGQGHNDHE